jgi:hypothetical protein
MSEAQGPKRKKRHRPESIGSSGPESGSLQSPSAIDDVRLQLETLRDTLLIPLIQQNERQQARISELEREIGRLVAEQDHFQRRLGDAVRELPAPQIQTVPTTRSNTRWQRSITWFFALGDIYDSISALAVLGGLVFLLYRSGVVEMPQGWLGMVAVFPFGVLFLVLHNAFVTRDFWVGNAPEIQQAMFKRNFVASTLTAVGAAIIAGVTIGVGINSLATQAAVAAIAGGIYRIVYGVRISPWIEAPARNSAFFPDISRADKDARESESWLEDPRK